MNNLIDFLVSMNLSSFTARDFIDISLVAVGIYYLLKIIQGTRAMRIALGIIFLVVLNNLSETYSLQVVQYLLDNFFTYLVIAIIILFQSELRRALAQLSKNPFKKRVVSRDDRIKTLEEITLACSLLSAKRIGCIIVLEREQGLRNIIEAGRILDALVNYDLLISLFNTSSPLHDGAVVIQDNRVAAASCFLPLTSSSKLSMSLGTRHRATIGITEETDALAVVVSEETGSIRLSEGGKISEPLDTKRLMRVMTDILIEDKTMSDSIVAGKALDTSEMLAQEN
jgi:diadenylate cyclase